LLNLLAGEAVAAANHLGADVVVGTGVDPVTSRFSGALRPLSVTCGLVA
jgi:hypothetical protein